MRIAVNKTGLNLTQLYVGGNLSIAGGSPWVDVKAFGALCDGSHDDATAIQRALNSISSGIVKIPKGTCVIKKQINISGNKLLIGEGWETSILQANTSFKYSLNGTIYVYGTQSGIENIYIKNYNNNISTVMIDSDYKPRMNYVKIVGGAIGISHVGGAEGIFNFIHILNTHGYGFYSTQPDLFTSYLYVQNASTGVYVTAGSQVMLHTHVVYSRFSGISIVGGNYGMWYGCYLDTGQSHGFSIYDTNKITITSCWFYKNGQVGTTKYGLYLDNVDDSTFIGIISKANISTMKDIYFDSDSSRNRVIGLATERETSTNKNMSIIDKGMNNYIETNSEGLLFSGNYILNATKVSINGSVDLNLNWTKLQNYATACSGKNLMQGVGDNLTCIADTDTFNTTNEIRTAVNNSKLNLKNSMNYPGDTNAMFLLNFTSRKSSKSIIEDFYMCNINAFEDMLGVAVSSGTLGVGTSASSHPGVCYLRDSTTAHGGYVIATDSAALLLSGGETSQFVFQRKNKKLLGIIRMGFLDQYTPRNRPSDGCYFDISNGNLSAQCRNNNATSQSARRNYTLTVDTWYVAKVFIEMNKLSANFTLYSGTTGQQLWSARLNNSIPINSSRQTGFGIIAGEGSTDAAADVVWIDYMSFNINGSLVR